MAALREGDRISNYLLEARVGAGSFGEVWRARHHVFEERVAIKIPTDPKFVRNLQREGVAIHGLRHPNIVRAIDLDPFADPPYLVMEYVEGPSLRQVIDQLRGAFPIPAAVVVMRGVMQAMVAAHENGMIHRDIKPANILVALPAEKIATITEQAVKVTDFGLGQVGGATTQSIMQSGSLLTEDGRSIAGTLAYMSPEQKEGKDIDARSDLYSCGLVLYEMLIGERPQGTDLPGAMREGVPGYLDDVFRRSYARLDRRFASATEMLAALSPTAAAPPPLPKSRRAAEGVTACPDCGTATQRDDQFCIGCGRQVAASVPRCPACGGFVYRTDRFCIFCGKDLGVLA